MARPRPVTVQRRSGGPGRGGSRLLRSAALATLATLAPLGASSASGQAPGPNAGDGVRIGITLGGISTVGLAVELYRDTRSLDLTLGTFSFHDVGVSAVVKQYVGGYAARPYVGAGLWLIGASSGYDRTGFGLVLRVPLGVDWTFTGRHSVGGAVNLDRALAVRRPDPNDTKPLSRGVVPLPGVYYRWRS